MSYRSSPLAHVRTHVDVSLLTASDRACLRLLERSRICTASQLANLIYPSIRTALRRTRKLWLNSLITRESLPAERGGIPVAYRLSESGRRRLHLNAYRSPGLVTIRHALDGVELVASLVNHDPGLVQLWRSESQIPELDGVKPDQLVVIDTGVASAWILVEVDESTERPPVIRERLNAYAKLFEEHRVGWHLLWVVNSPERLARLRQIAGPLKLAALADRCWGVPIGEVSDAGASAHVLAVGASLPPRPLRAIATDPKARRTEYPVGSAAWMRLLANGGIEDVSGLRNGFERKAAVSARAVEPETEAKVAEVEKPPADEPSVPAAEAPRADVSAIVTPARTAAPAEAGADLRLMHGGALVHLILDADGDGPRAARAVELLVQRGNSYFLFDELERLCRSGVTEQLRCLKVVRNLRPPADDSYRKQAQALLLRVVDQRTEPAVMKAALESLEAVGLRAEGSS
jgi:Replication-relaxation